MKEEGSGPDSGRAGRLEGRALALRSWIYDTLKSCYGWRRDPRAHRCRLRTYWHSLLYSVEPRDPSEYVQHTELPPSIAFHRYTTQDLGRSPRAWAIKMILYANAVGIPSNIQLFKVRVRFDPSLRRDIPTPRWTTRMIDFLDHIDEMYPIWRMKKEQGAYSISSQPSSQL